MAFLIRNAIIFIGYTMQATFIPYRLQFKYPFKISHGLRTGTNVVYVKLQHQGHTAWGEATLPPYLPETQQGVFNFLQGFAAKMGNAPAESWFQKLEEDTTGNRAAKAALDMALWSLKAQLQGCTLSQALGIEATCFPPGTYTIGISTAGEMKTKIADGLAAGFGIFKLKLDGHNDEAQVENFKAYCNKPFAVDVNQGWPAAQTAIAKVNRLQQQGCLLVEQPLSTAADAAMAGVKAATDLPLYADESCQTIADVERLVDGFSGINIKLMKCGGITPALAIIKRAKQLDLKILIGCMSESSVGCTAAAHLTPLADYADLDGPWLISNDPFTGIKMNAGRIVLNPLSSTIPL